MTEILFTSARVLSGDETSAPVDADVLVADGVIAKIAPPGSLAAEGGSTDRRRIDAAGHFLAPGFIDMHAHSDLYLLTNPTHEAKITQGCTTEVVGQDGISYHPVQTPQQMLAIREQIAGWNGNPSDAECESSPHLQGVGLFDWRSTGEYLACLARNRTATNVAVLVPQGNLRLLACGPHDAPATQEQVEAQTELLRTSMREGAVGMSSGLTYTPGMYASTSELAQLCKVLAEEFPGAFYAPHHRSYGFRAIESYGEMLELGLQTGCPIHLTHATLNFAENKDRAPTLISMVDEHIGRGVDVTLDTYPYLPGCTTLAALLPSWASSGGPSETLKRLEDADTREKIRVDVEVKGCDGGHGIPTNWDEIQVGEVYDATIAHYSGQLVSAISRNANPQKQPIDIFFEILQKERLATSCLMHIGNEWNVQQILQHRTHMAGSDAILHGAKVHPRAYGTFPRFIGHYARDLNLMSIPSMIAHMTSRPAKRLGIYPQRGCIAEGSAADLVLFDPEAIKDMATFDEPKLPSRGIRFVLVNGQMALDEGKVVGVRNGRVLRRDLDGNVAAGLDGGA